MVYSLYDETGKKIMDLPILPASEGPSVIDVRELYQKTGCFTYDPGFSVTANCESQITYIDGEEGILLHRGYAIEDLAENYNFMDIAFLLLHGALPSPPEKQQFEENLKDHSLLHEQINYFFRGFRRDAHPMAIMVGVVGALSAFYHDSLDIQDPEQRQLASYRLIAKMPTIAASAYKYSIGQPFIYPQNHLNYAENFLHMLFATPSQPYEVNPVFANALDKIFILHADHEQNASTATVRLAGSSGANPFACIASGIAALWGPAHGGANEAVLKMLQEIGTEDNVPLYLEKVKKKTVRLMGFGHRVYKNYDPRAKILKRISEEVFKELGTLQDPLLALALELEQIALNDPYFIERKLYPNVDFYSGIILRALGIPVSMFTVFFAVARSVGWISQWNEMMKDPHQKIGRPRQLYKGVKRRPVPKIK